MHDGFKHLEEEWSKAARRGDARNAVALCDGTDAGWDASGAASAQRLFNIALLAGAYVLEFGCGLGRVTRHLSAAYRHVWAVDLAQPMLDAVELLNLPNVTAVKSNGSDIGTHIKLGTIDVLYSDYVLLHNRKREVFAVWPKLMETLKPGGFAAFQVPVYEQGACDPLSWTDVGIWSVDDMTMLARACGCTAEKVWINPGHFSYEAIGPYHSNLHIFAKSK